MRRTDLGAAAVLGAAAAWALLYLIPSQTSPAQSETTMSPAMMPTLAVALILVLALVLLASSWRRRDPVAEAEHEEFGAEARGLGRAELIELAIWTVTATLLMVVMKYAGFVAAGAGVLLAAMLFAGQRSPWVLAAVALGTPLLIELTARQLFGVMMP